MVDEYSYRTFNGKRFAYHAHFSGKVGAETQAESLRKRGWLARITHEDGKNIVWKRRP